MNTPLPAIEDAPWHARQALLDAYLTWLEHGAHQTQQIHGWLYGDGETCCALGALGRVLEAHGYARVQGRHLITRERGPDHAPALFASRMLVSPSVLRALGLTRSAPLIAQLSDRQHATFAQIAAALRATRPHVPG